MFKKVHQANKNEIRWKLASIKEKINTSNSNYMDIYQFFPLIKISLKDNQLFKANIVTVHYRVYKIYSSTMFGNNSAETRQGEMKVSYCKVLIQYK